jgi:hypothetical protein
MKRTQFLLLAAAVVVGAGGVLLARQQQENVPGFPTLARVYVLNREPLDAIGVRVQDATVTLPVAVTGTANVALAPNAVVATRQTRQGWEYRQLTATASQDVAELLNKVGTEGWEAVGTVPSAGNSLTLILKRPR